MSKIQFARNEYGIYQVISKYERNSPTDLCVVLGDFHTGKWVNEAYESSLKIGSLIDLIEPGDIVNNHYVKAVYLDGAVKYMKLDNSHSVENNFSGVRTYEDDIKTILTKEQMEANQYVIKRNMETN